MTLSNTKLRVLLLLMAIVLLTERSGAQGHMDNVVENNNFSQAEFTSAEFIADTSKPLLRDALRKLNSVTGLYFLYSDETIGNIRVNALSAKAGTPEKMLVELLKGTHLEFKKVSDDTYAIVQKRTAIFPPQNDTPDRSFLSGKVIDKDGNPLQGASVQVKGTKRGAVANAKGEFKIEA